MNTEKIVINGESFNCSKIQPFDLVTAKDKMYLFWGIDWRALETTPSWDTISTLEIDGKRYNAKQVANSDINPRPGHWHLFHNNKWYEMAPQTAKIVFETGATSSAVNELILYTDNDSKLSGIRDAIYELHFYSGLEPLAINLIPLLDKAELSYYREFKVSEENKHIYEMEAHQHEEYCQIYANRFPEWKKERERNP